MKSTNHPLINKDQNYLQKACFNVIQTNYKPFSQVDHFSKLCFPGDVTFLATSCKITGVGYPHKNHHLFYSACWVLDIN